MGLSYFSVWFFRGACCLSWRCSCLFSTWVWKRIWGWACDIRWWGTKLCTESSHGFCIEFVAVYWYCFGYVGDIGICFFWIGASEAAMIFSGGDDIPTEVDTPPEASQDADVALLHDVWSFSLVVLQFLLQVSAPSAVESCWRRRWITVCILSDGVFGVAFHDCLSFLVVVNWDYFSNDPAVTPIMTLEIRWWHCAGPFASKKGK